MKEQENLCPGFTQHDIEPVGMDLWYPVEDIYPGYVRNGSERVVVLLVCGFLTKIQTTLFDQERALAFVARIGLLRDFLHNVCVCTERGHTENSRQPLLTVLRTAVTNFFFLRKYTDFGN